MMKFLVILIFLCFSVSGMTQQNFLPLHSFYKDQLFANKLNRPYNGGGFLPANEANYDLVNRINDSTPQYYTVTHILFQKHLIEINARDAYITISPAANISGGRDFGDTVSRTLFQNTRGIHVEGDFFKNFSFSTSFYENQARFAQYETSYYSSLGERYPSSNGYQTQNAVIPGAGRTKPFKEDAFDFGYAIGCFVYAPWKSVKIAAGNNPQFIGDGHRSLLLSDNSYSAPYFRIDWTPVEKFSMTYFRSRLLNLLRKPATSSAEAYYEQKGYSVNYFTFRPNENSSISLFEGTIWNRGDSITSRSANALYYNPVPIISGILLDGKNEAISLLGINAHYQLGDRHRLYAQVAMNDLDGSKLAYQLGIRGYNYFGLNDFMIQLEYNNVPSGMYETTNPRLNYSHYNLPLAHVKGSGFQEFLLRSNYEYKRVYADLNLSLFLTQDYSSQSHLPIYQTPERTSSTILNSTLEIGYRFNRKMNLSVFAACRFRSDSDPNVLTATILQAGFRTALLNHYNDF